LNVVETLKFLEAFPACKPQIFSSFPEFPEYTYRANQYIVFVKASAVDLASLSKLEAFAKAHNLRIKRFGLHLMFYEYAW
jgi:hypothetical protein